MCQIKKPTVNASTDVSNVHQQNAATNTLISLGKRKFIPIPGESEPLKVQKIIDNQSFISAIRSGHEGLFKELIEQTNINECDPLLKNSPIHFASFYNRILFVRILITKGVELNQINQQGATALSTAVEKGHTLIVKMLIDAGADISILDKQGFSILHKAVLTGNTEILNFIVSKLDSKLSVDCLSVDKLTPLHQAAYHGKLSMVKILITEGGANVNVTSNTNTTPLHLASIKNHKKVIKYLISNKANVDAVDNHNRTPLHYAAIYGHVDAATCLVDGKAKFDILDIHEQTPLSIFLHDHDVSLSSLTEQTE